MAAIATTVLLTQAPAAPAAAIAPIADRRRSLRVLTLIAAIVLMSLGDLYMTLVHLSTVGMGEANPIARYIIGYNSPALLAVWKLASVTLACLIFARFRTRWTAEAACWLCTFVLAGLTLMWINYSTELSTLTCSLPGVTQCDYSAWVHMSD